MSHNLSHLWKLRWFFSLSIVSVFPSFFLSYNGFKFATRVRAALVRETADFIRNLTAAVTSTTQTTTTTTSSSTTAQPQPNSATNRDTVRSEHNRLFGTGRQLRRELLEILIAIKGGGRPTRLLPYAKMLFIPRKFFFLCWVDYALEGSTFSLSKCDFSRMFHTERS